LAAAVFQQSVSSRQLAALFWVSVIRFQLAPLTQMRFAMKFCATLLLLAVTLGYAQFFPDSHSIDVTGDAAINVAPDRVRLNFGVETRNKALDAAVIQNDAIVRRVMAAVPEFQVDAGDIQTENIQVTLGYDSHDNTLIDYYEVTKGVQVFLRDVSKFEPC
jgi:uncharacterized protein YggE